MRDPSLYIALGVEHVCKQLAKRHRTAILGP